MISGASLKVYDTAEELHGAVVGMVEDVINASLRDHGVCLLALSGGETPRPIYRLLASSAEREKIDWRRIHILFADERMVPPDDPLSNFGMVHQELIAHLPIPPENVHRIAGEKDPRLAASEYEAVVEGLMSGEDGKVDLVLLGLGADGHTASLFPDSPSTGMDQKIQSPYVKEIGAWRVTMTLPFINSARRVIFIVTGKKKAEILRRLTDQTEPSPLLPASQIRPASGDCLWMVDRDAASDLT